MSWDPVHSFSYPEPQTPTRTPASFGDSFPPKLESSFFDPRVTWDTSDPYASSPELHRTPQRFGLASTLKGGPAPSHGESYKGRVDQTDTAKRIRAVRPNQSASEDYPPMGSAKSAASMQTPPPTSASRRKIPEFDEGDGPGATPGMGHLETPSRLLGASPRMFGNLQSSPDLFQLASLDPTGSPFFPQQRLFWDQDLENAGEVPLPTSNGLDSHQNSDTHHIPQLPTIDGSIDLPEFGNGFGISAAPPTDAALFPAPFSTSPRIPVTKAEDPALFLSSPARRFGGPHLTPQTRSLRGIRQPYHHQTEESKREELLRAQAPDGQRPTSFVGLSESEEEDDDFTPRGTRPGLTRSVTHTAITSSHRPLSQAGGMMASTSGIRKSPSKGRSSPAKGMRSTPLARANSVATGLPTRSSSVVLRIGRDGRAKAEMEPVDEGPTGLTDPLTGMDLDGSATESEADPAEYSEYPVLQRAQSSFSIFDLNRRPLSRSDSGSRPPSKGSYASTVGSSHSGRKSPWASSSRGAGRVNHRGSPDIKRTPKRHSSLLHSDSTYTRGSAASDSLPGEDDDSGDATHALRQVLKERGRGPRPSINGFNNRLSRSSHTFTHLRSSPPRLGSDFDIHPRHNASPTTLTDPDLATPSTDRHSNPSNGTRCVCRSMDNGGHLMIQCESCTHWLHTRCVGLERANLPSVYVCIFCAQTPSRQNRARTSYVPTGNAPPSPLAHKSYRVRAFIRYVCLSPWQPGSPPSQYDLSTYWGRVRHAADIADPRTLFVSGAGLESAKSLIASYKQNRIPVMTPELWSAKKVVDATLHPDTGTPVLLPFRMSAYVFSNLVVTAGMLTPGLGTSGTLLWQIGNQSLNVAINNANANKSTPLSTSQIAQSYLMAVSASCSTALGLKALVPRLKSISPNTRLILSRLVPFAAVASASALNVFLMRGEEIRQGIDVYPVLSAEERAKRELIEDAEPVQSLGKSKKAATLAVGETAISRVLNATPIMVLPPLILVKLEKTQWLRARPRMIMPVNLALILGTSLFALPLALAAFPSRQAISASSLEEEFRGRGGDQGMVEFNRGM